MHFTFAWRYFKAKKSTNAINIISWVSVTAIMIGTASLIVILSAFNGFESLVRSLYNSFYADLKVVPAKGKTLRLSEEQLLRITSWPGVRNVARIAEEKALLQNGDLQTIVSVKGVDSQYRHVAGIEKAIFRGRYEMGSQENPKAVLGVGVENAVGVLSDRTITPLIIYLPKKGSTNLSDPLESLSQGEIVPAGSFAIQAEFDNKYVITNLDFLRTYLNYAADEYSSLELALVRPSDEGRLQQSLRSWLGSDFRVLTRYEQNASLYSTIVLEKWAIYGIFVLILLVAAFNMIGALSMLVLEKKKDIQVLQAMGAGKRLIRKIFLSQGLLLAALGAIAGTLLALVLIYLQLRFKLVPLQGQSFLIDYYPVKLVAGDILLVISTVLCIGLMASWIPSLRAARQPFELRN